MNLSRPALLLLFSVLTLAALVTGFLFSRSLLQSDAPNALIIESTAETGPMTTLRLGEQRPDFTHADRDGRWVSMSDFDGAVVLVNFWATWCEPCREEMPLLQRWADQYESAGLRIVGIALDDVARAREFAAAIQIRYPLLVGGPDVLETSQRWGNRRGVLPYSVLVDRGGVVRWAHFGPLDEQILMTELLPWLN